MSSTISEETSTCLTAAEIGPQSFSPGLPTSITQPHPFVCMQLPSASIATHTGVHNGIYPFAANAVVMSWSVEVVGKAVVSVEEGNNVAGGMVSVLRFEKVTALMIVS